MQCAGKRKKNQYTDKYFSIQDRNAPEQQLYTPDKTNTRTLILLAHTVLHSNNKEKLTVSSSIYSCPARYVQIEDQNTSNVLFFTF